MKNSADLGGCYPPPPLALVNNTLLDLQNSLYPTQPHSIIAKYSQLHHQPSTGLIPNNSTTCSQLAQLVARALQRYQRGQ